MRQKNNDRTANLIKPNELGRFVTQTDEHNAAFPLLHEKFKVNRIEKFRPFMKFPLPPHRKPVYDFLFLKKGAVTRSKSIDTYSLSPNSFFFLPAYQILSNETMSEDVEGFYGHFSTDIFNKKIFQKDFTQAFSFLKYNGNPIVQIPESLTPVVLEILERLEHEFDSGAKNGFDLICTYLLALFLEIKPYQVTEKKNASAAAAGITQRYKEALTKHIYEYQKVSDYARLLSVSPNHLNRCVRGTLGRSAKDVLFEILLLEIKVLLKQTTLSISEIAYKLSKKDPSDFTRFFKSKTGMTPKEYRLS